MRKKKVWTVLQVTAFLLVGALLFELLQAILMDKSSYALYRSWKAQEDVDILVLGNSHAANGVSTYLLEDKFAEEYGAQVSVFNYAVFGMRMEQMYFFTKEILKTRKPKLIIVETYAFCPLADEHRAILAHRAFDSFHLSVNKIQAINYCVLEDRWSYYIPLISYHSRWKELSWEDVAVLYDKDQWNSAGRSWGAGYTESCPDPGDGWFAQDTAHLETQRALTPSEEECLEKFLALLEENDIRLLFFSIPYKIQMDLDSVEQVKINNYLQERYVNGDTVQLLDLNRRWQEIDFGYADLVDEGHVNAVGAQKVSACLSQYLKAHYDVAALA